MTASQDSGRILASGASIVLIETLFFLVALVVGPRSRLLAGRRARREAPGTD